MKNASAWCCAWAVLAATVATAHGQSYPAKPVRVVVAAAPGGGTDFVARVLSSKLTENLGQPIVIDNRGGAGGSIGTDIVAKSAPDGYTLLMVFVNFSIYPSLYQKLPFDPVRGFAPITTLATTPLILEVNPQVRAKSIKELIALGKAPGAKLNYAAPEIKERLSVEGLDPASRTPEEFAAIIKSDITKWSKVVNEAGIKPE